ncbi:hypothetical protein [Cohnella sp.]|uniref:hypothetical protein n=1 Tax=Cohnella sp. TaxID=1883426 RepID=UPI003563175A
MITSKWMTVFNGTSWTQKVENSDYLSNPDQYLLERKRVAAIAAAHFRHGVAKGMGRNANAGDSSQHTDEEPPSMTARK